MSSTVAPPPRNGGAAQGPGRAEASSAIDRAETPPPADEPTHPLPAAAPRTAAAGILLALFSAGIAAVATLSVLVVRLLSADAERLETGGPSLVLLVIGFALGNAAALLLVTRDWTQPRPTTLLLATVAAVAWPLSGSAWLAAPVAIVLVGLLVARDRGVPGGPRVTGVAGTLVLALIALVTAVAGAVTSPAPARDHGAVAGVTATSGGATATPTAEPTGGEQPPAPGVREPAREAPDAPIAVPGDAPAPPAKGDAAPPSAASFVRGYYRDLDAQRFAEAWSALSPAVQAALGPYARWKAGYAATVYSRPREITVEGDSARTSVTHILVARDKGCDGERQFRVTWELRGDGDRWVVSSLGAVVAGSTKC